MERSRLVAPPLLRCFVAPKRLFVVSDSVPHRERAPRSMFPDGNIIPSPLFRYFALTSRKTRVCGMPREMARFAHLHGPTSPSRVTPRFLIPPDHHVALPSLAPPHPARACRPG